MTRSVGRPVVESRGGGTCKRVGKGGGKGRKPREGNDEHFDDLNGQGNEQGLGANRGVEGFNENVGGVNGSVGGAPEFSTIIAQQLHNLLLAMLAQSFVLVMKCKSWKLSCRITPMVEVCHAAYTNRFHELARLVPHLVTPESRKIKKYVYGLAMQISGALTDEAVQNGSIKKVEKRGNAREPSKDKNGRDDNKRTRTRNAFASTSNPVGRDDTSHLEKDCRGVPRNVNAVNARNLTVRACYECGSIDHVWSACPRLNRAQGPKGNHPNQVVANNEGHGRGNQGNRARGRAFMLGAEEARQDPNIVTATFTLNNYFATTLFDFGADISFVSTTFIPLLGIEPSELGFRYEIEIDSGKLVEIDKVIKSCKLEIEGYVFDIDLIPFGHGSFDVIIGMDWLSNHKAKIICHENVVRIPLPDGKVLRVLGERPEEKVRLFLSAEASDKKQKEIVVVRDFPKVFLDDLSRLPFVREIEFRIELIPGAIPITKSPYRLAPSELEDLSSRLKEL
nr:hypothetical protein [Tanacetum cinerariifolium]